MPLTISSSRKSQPRFSVLKPKICLPRITKESVGNGTLRKGQLTENWLIQLKCEGKGSSVILSSDSSRRVPPDSTRRKRVSTVQMLSCIFPVVLI